MTKSACACAVTLSAGEMFPATARLASASGVFQSYGLQVPVKASIIQLVAQVMETAVPVMVNGSHT
jgi:hypothetical protein